MKDFIKPILFIALIAFAGCSSDEDPDPRAAFEGTYEMDDFDVELTDRGESMSWEVKTSPEIEFSLADETLDPDELSVELKELIKEIWTGYLLMANGAFSISVDIEDEIIAEISNNKLEIEDFSYTVTSSNGEDQNIIQCFFEAEGEIEGSEITIEFENSGTGASGGIFLMTGIAKGDKK